MVCAIPCAWLGRKIEQKRREREAVEAIVKAGGKVQFDYEVGNSSAEPPGPRWLRTLLGERFFSDIIIIDLRRANIELI